MLKQFSTNIWAGCAVRSKNLIKNVFCFGTFHIFFQTVFLFRQLYFFFYYNNTTRKHFPCGFRNVMGTLVAWFGRFERILSKTRRKLVENSLCIYRSPDPLSVFLFVYTVTKHRKYFLYRNHHTLYSPSSVCKCGSPHIRIGLRLSQH